MAAIFNGNSLEFLNEGVIISTTSGYSSKNISSLNGVFSLNSSSPTIDNVIYNNSDVSEIILYSQSNAYIIKDTALHSTINGPYSYDLMFPAGTISEGLSTDKAIFCSTIVNNSCPFSMHYKTTYAQSGGDDIAGDWIIFPINVPSEWFSTIHQPNRTILSIRIVFWYNETSSTYNIRYNTSCQCGWFDSVGNILANNIPFTGMIRYTSNTTETTSRELHVWITMLSNSISVSDVSYGDFAIVFNPGILDTSISSATGSLMFTLASF